MTSHVLLMLLFAALVSVVFAAMLREGPREQARLAARIFGGFVLVAVALGWLMYPFPL